MSARNLRDKRTGLYFRFGKRCLDLSLSVPSLFILSPVFLLSALMIKLETPGPVVFSHERMGKDRKPFRLYKFRTMVKDASKMGLSITSANDARITKVGRLLRTFKIDEMLQIINVVKGDMSVIGPRPEVKKYIDMFAEDYSDVLKIKPGMTDYALIAFRNEEDILSRFKNAEEGYINEVLPEKLKLYRKYINEMSFKTDIKIFFTTIWEVLRR
jgi:lipopolysaccharide/colanic/teichoic acid biosynthesis glycosyltransferase